MVAAVSSLLDWLSRAELTHWHSVAEAVAVTTLIIGTSASAGLGAYLAVPAAVAGVRHGLVTTLNVTLLSIVTAAATLAVDPSGDAVRHVATSLPWIAIGLGVGLLASWQSRSTRDLAARQAPYAAAHQSMARLHQLASAGSLGLDSASLATELDTAMRRATGAARTSVFVLDNDQLRPLLAGSDQERLIAEIHIPEADRTPGAAVVPLRGAHQLLGYAVLVGVPRWTRGAQLRGHGSRRRLRRTPGHGRALRRDPAPVRCGGAQPHRA